MIESLPEHLRERTRVHGNITVSEKSSYSFVLYWMRSAVRTDENPALDVARWIASKQRVSLLVYHAISEHYQYASDRHHTFMLQGACDVQQQFTQQGISYAFHLASLDDRRPHLVTLSNMASVVVTEDMPVDPPRRFLNALKRKTRTPIFSVDTACVAPMQLLKKPYVRAFNFRSATKEIYAERLSKSWPEPSETAIPFDKAMLPFQPIDLQSTNLSQLLSRCEIDHAIGPVLDTVGGSTAGYQRWNEFKENSLTRYAKQRNNALLDGVSRLSPYLRYGMVSPLRIAREAAKVNNAGSEKFLDELLIWRELAYTFCFYRDDHNAWSAIPDWARTTLSRHSADHRQQIYTWEQLARGQTNDRLWNAAQKSLLMQGELHNNVRMTWGKAILNWKRSPQEALATIIDLNHRYALDGRDPASYGGILWCLGQFDRPFEPERTIVGTVRPRPTAAHARRLDPQRYLAKVTKPKFDPVPNVAIVGAGISGLFAARTLQDHGTNVKVFEKSRGVGGRMATRRAEGETTFDFGAQYFTARDPRFIRYVDSWFEQGIVARWPDRQLGAAQKIVVLKNGVQSESDSEDRFVAVPTMNSICKHLAEHLEIQTQTRIARIDRFDDGVKLVGESEESLGTYDRLIISAPAAQSAELLADFPVLANQISKLEMSPCWAVMASFAKPVTDQWVGAFLHDSFLSWAARNNTKPGRHCDAEQLILHACPEWTAENWERSSIEVANAMLEEFWLVAGIRPQATLHLQVHRWKYAKPVNAAAVPCFMDKSAAVTCCGDWAGGSRVEGAFLSGMSAAGRVLGVLEPTSRFANPKQEFLFK